MNFTRINGTIINLDLVRQFYAIHQNPRNPFHSSLVFVWGDAQAQGAERLAKTTIAGKGSGSDNKKQPDAKAFCDELYHDIRAGTIKDDYTF